MFNVVVDSEQTGKLLLEKGGLQRRITIIPLNKIQASGVPARAQAAATKLVNLIPSSSSKVIMLVASF